MCTYTILRHITFLDGKQQDVGNCDFVTRLTAIEREIIGPRNKFIQQGLIDKEAEPFRVRLKQFWDISETHILLGPKFKKDLLGHEPDGLVFQPVDHVSDDITKKLNTKDALRAYLYDFFFQKYECGRDDKILKWKPSSHNSVDFKLQIVREEGLGMVPKSVGKLWVGGFEQPFSQIKLNAHLRQLNNKIIECKWDYEKNGWSFMRERTDKSFPNAYTTAMGK